MPAVEETVRRIIGEQLGMEPSELTPGANFQNDLGADSLDMVALVMAFEEAFDMEIPDEDAQKMQTVQEVIDYIQKNAKSVKH